MSQGPIQTRERGIFAWLRHQVAITREKRAIIRAERCPECASGEVTKLSKERRHCELCDFEWEIDRGFKLGEGFGNVG